MASTVQKPSTVQLTHICSKGGSWRDGDWCVQNFYSAYLSPGYLVLPPLQPFYFKDGPLKIIWVGSYCTNPFLYTRYVFSSFHPSLPLFPHGVLQLLCGLLRFFASPPPSPIPSSSPSPLLLSFRPRSRPHPVCVYLLNCTQPCNPALSFYATRTDPPRRGTMILSVCVRVCLYLLNSP